MCLYTKTWLTNLRVKRKMKRKTRPEKSEQLSSLKGLVVVDVSVDAFIVVFN